MNQANLLSPEDGSLTCDYEPGWTTARVNSEPLKRKYSKKFVKNNSYRRRGYIVLFCILPYNAYTHTTLRRLNQALFVLSLSLGFSSPLILFYFRHQGPYKIYRKRQTERAHRQNNVRNQSIKTQPNTLELQLVT